MATELSCAPQTLSLARLAEMRAADGANLAKREIEPARVRAMDGSPCVARTADGVALSHDGGCSDLGTAHRVSPAADGTTGHTPMDFLPPARLLRVPPGAELAAHSARLRAAAEALQFPPASAGSCHRNVFYMHVLPQVGFGSVIEYAIMFLGRSIAIGSQLRLGRESSQAWTSPWFCGRARSLGCYFNLTSCCSAVHLPSGEPLLLPRRRDPINVGARGHNHYGSAWVSAQLTAFLFERLTPQTRRELSARRATVAPFAALATPPAGGGRPLLIGMHIRRGDSCHRSRFCPANLTASYFGAAARLRSLYGANRLLLATDDPEAARLCAASVLGFDCRTQSLERTKFASATLIEDRVATHAEGSLSGSAVALDALADISMLADADMFVLLLRSCFARVAYALATGRRGRPPPVISLEAPWSPYRPAKGGRNSFMKGMRGKGGGIGGFRTRRP